MTHQVAGRGKTHYWRGEGREGEALLAGTKRDCVTIDQLGGGVVQPSHYTKPFELLTVVSAT